MSTPFDQWYATHYGEAMPWDVSRDALRAAWDAGLAESTISMRITGTADLESGVIVFTPNATYREITANDIYKAYPRKVGKAAAIKAINKALHFISGGVAEVPDRIDPHKTPADWLLDRVETYATAVAKWPKEERKFVPHPATWFNQGRYDDDPAEWQRGDPAQSSQFSKVY